MRLSKVQKKKALRTILFILIVIVVNESGKIWKIHARTRARQIARYARAKAEKSRARVTFFARIAPLIFSVRKNT